MRQVTRSISAVPAKRYRYGRCRPGRRRDQRRQGRYNQLNTIAGNLTIDGQAGFNTLTVNDQNAIAPNTYTVSSTSIARTGGPECRLYEYAGASRSTPGKWGSNTVHIRSPHGDALRQRVNAAALETPALGVNAVDIGSGGSVQQHQQDRWRFDDQQPGNSLSTLEVDDQTEGALRNH